MSRQEFEDNIRSIQSNIDNFRQALNNEALWLFVVTVGCYGIPNNIMQSIAMIITFVFYFSIVEKARTDTKPFKDSIECLRKEIKNTGDINNDTTKAILYDLDKFEQHTKLPLYDFLKKYPFYWIAILFYFFALLDMVEHF